MNDGGKLFQSGEKFFDGPQLYDILQSAVAVVGGVEKSHAVARGISAGSERDCQVTVASRSQRQHSVTVLRRLYISSHQSASSLVTMFF